MSRLPADGVADAARHRAVFGNGVLQLIAHHRRLALRRQRLQFFVNRAERGHAVVVVRVDDGERLVDVVARNEHRVHRAERLGALFRHVIESRHAREILEGVTTFTFLAIRSPQMEASVSFMPGLMTKTTLSKPARIAS